MRGWFWMVYRKQGTSLAVLNDTREWSEKDREAWRRLVNKVAVGLL